MLYFQQLSHDSLTQATWGLDKKAQVAQLVEQNIENVWVIGLNPILGTSFDFGEDRKRAALIIHARKNIAQVSNVLELTYYIYFMLIDRPEPY